MSGEPIKPIDAGAVPEIARHYLGGVLPLDITIVATYLCAGCHKAHLVKHRIIGKGAGGSSQRSIAGNHRRYRRLFNHRG